MDTKLRLVEGTSDLESTRVRGMREVAEEARAREQVAMRGSRVADAAMYREIAERAEAGAARERRIGYVEGLRITDAEERIRAGERILRTSQDRARELATWGGIVLALVGLVVLIALSSGCSMPEGGTAGRPATAEDASAAPLTFAVRDGTGWVGAALVELTDLGASASLGEGFDGLAGCLEPELAGAWDVSGGGVILAELIDASGTVVRLDGTLIVHAVTDPAGWVPFETLTGSGTWTISAGPGCPAGLSDSGTWTCERTVPVPETVGPRPGTRARALLIGEDGTVVEVVGPREETLAIALQAVQ